MKEQLERIEKEGLDLIRSAGSVDVLEALRVRFLGKKGELTAILRGMGELSAEDRPAVGQVANRVRLALEGEIDKRKAELEAAQAEERLRAERLDVTLPGRYRKLGRRHPISIVREEIEAIFIGMGFRIAEGPEIETDYYNFEALNTPKNHPARDTQDTFYISEDVVLRTQTSAVQIRHMEKHKPPIRVIAPGRVYRADEIDATHGAMFNQIEGLVVDRGITMGNLKATLETFFKALFGPDARIRLRPHHFPFTEPSAEVDVSCFACGGSGCRVCKQEGWIELLGAGMVHPKVLANCGIDPEEYSGFAFGMGLDRIVMRRYGIDDMRLLTENDMRFLRQF